MRATRVEGAAGGRVQRVGHLALHGRAGAAGVFHLRNGVQQHTGVGVLRCGEELLFVRHLDEPAQVHHTHLVGHMAHDGEVVADEEVGQALLALQVFHDVEHLRLHTHIECRRGFVTHQEFGLRGQGAGDGNTLALATGKLVWVLAHVQWRQAHGLQQFTHPGFQSGFVRQDAVLTQGFTNDVLHDPARVEAGIRVLEDHLDAAAQLAAFGRLESGMGVLPVELEASARGVIQAHQQARHGAFATARFTDQGQCFAAFNGEAHAVHGM